MFPRFGLFELGGKLEQQSVATFRRHELRAMRQAAAAPIQRHRHGRLASDVGKRGERRLQHGFADGSIQQFPRRNFAGLHQLSQTQGIVLRIFAEWFHRSDSRLLARGMPVSNSNAPATTTTSATLNTPVRSGPMPMLIKSTT